MSFIQEETRGFSDPPRDIPSPRYQSSASSATTQRASHVQANITPLQARRGSSSCPKCSQLHVWKRHKPATPNYCPTARLPVHKHGPGTGRHDPCPALLHARAEPVGNPWLRGRGYLHTPPMTPAILQSHLYHQVMPSSAEGAAGSGAAAWNWSS